MKTFVRHFLPAVMSIVVIAGLFIGCDPCEDNDIGEPLTDAGLDFELIDAKTGKSLFTNPLYSADSVRLLTGTTTLRKFDDGYQNYTFRIDSVYKSPQNTIGTRVDETFYLYLNRTDIDTIRLSFLPIEGRCNPYFTEYQVFYNQRLMATSRNTVSFSTVIKK